MPRVETHGGKNSKIEKSGATTRDELYNNTEKNAPLNGTYLILVVLSTIVVAIGLLEDNVAVVMPPFWDRTSRSPWRRLWGIRN